MTVAPIVVAIGLALGGCAAKRAVRVTAAGDLQLGAGLTADPLAGAGALLDGDLRFANLEGAFAAGAVAADDARDAQPARVRAGAAVTQPAGEQGAMSAHPIRVRAGAAVTQPVRERVDAAVTQPARERADAEGAIAVAAADARAAQPARVRADAAVTQPARERAGAEGAPFVFAPARAQWLHGRIDVVSLANNHALDGGPAARDGTARLLAGDGIASAWPDHAAVVTRGATRVTVLAAAFAPDAALDGDSAARLVAAVARARRDGPVLVSLHWGHTGLLLPTPEQRRLAARLVDAGAAALLGHGPHTPMGVERRGGAVIAYSLGNLAFGCDCTDASDAFVLAFTLAPDGSARDVTLRPIRAGLLRPVAAAHDRELAELLAALSRDLGADATVAGELVRLR